MQCSSHSCVESNDYYNLRRGGIISHHVHRTKMNNELLISHNKERVDIFHIMIPHIENAFSL